MKLEHASTMFLRIFILLFGLLVLAICLFVVPWLGHVASLFFSVFWTNFILMCLFGAALPLYYALYHTWKLLNFIDKKDAFAHHSIHALLQVKRCAIAISGLHIMILPFVYHVADVDDAPGLILIGCIIPGAAMVIAVFAAVLQRLLFEALEMKQDNELTI